MMNSKEVPDAEPNLDVRLSRVLTCLLPRGVHVEPRAYPIVADFRALASHEIRLVAYPGY